MLEDATTSWAPSSFSIFAGSKNSSSRNCVCGTTSRTFLPSSFIGTLLLECLLMINLKSPKEIEIMKGASKIVAEILQELKGNVRDGATTADLDRIAEDLIVKKKAKPAFKGYRGFPAVLCISVNE